KSRISTFVLVANGAPAEISTRIVLISYFSFMLISVFTRKLYDVGVRKVLVILYLSISASTSSARKDSCITSVPPTSSCITTKIHGAERYIGTSTRRISDSTILYYYAAAIPVNIRKRCDITTPFGFPVVPEVYPI